MVMLSCLAVAAGVAAPGAEAGFADVDVDVAVDADEDDDEVDAADAEGRPRTETRDETAAHTASARSLPVRWAGWFRDGVTRGLLGVGSVVA